MKRGILAGAAVAGLFVLTAVMHEAVREAMLAAGERCVCVLIPSLYLYAVLAAFCTGSGLLGAAAAPLDRVTWRFFRIDAQLLTVLVFSQLGGYPVGAQLLHGLYERGTITREQEQRLLCACIGCGPGFLFGTVCMGLPGRLSLWMLLSVMLPNLAVGCILLHGLRTRQERRPMQTDARVFTQSVDSAAAGMMKICAMVLLFSAVLAVTEETGVLTRLPERVQQIIRPALEVSNLTEFRASGGDLPTAAALLSFGGICVHLQIASISGGLPWRRFWLWRIPAAAGSFGLCRVGIRLLPGAVPASVTVQETQVFSRGAVPGICLVILSLMLLRMRGSMLTGTGKRRPLSE